MIKFFRNIRQQLFTENPPAGRAGKFSKYLTYAFGEIILVVIGILIALQINTWNVNRLDRIKEIKYLKNIKLDLTKDIKSTAYNINFRKKKLEGTTKLLSQINGQAIDDVSELTFNVLNTLYQERFQPSNVTFKELNNSGNLNLISNDSIKLLLLELEILYQNNTFGIEHETFEYHEFISKSIFRNVNLEPMKLVFLGEKAAQEMNIKEQDFNKLFQSQEYKNGCLVVNWTTVDMISIYESIESTSKKIIALIDTEIES